MKNQILFIILILGSCILHLDSYGQITRGSQPGEIYLSTDWYIDNYGDTHYAIFRSVDHGATITLQYESSMATPPDEMSVGKVLGDATPGALYNYGNYELWVSLDYGESWEYREYLGNTNYMSGQIGGTIFRRVGAELSISNNYGSGFTIATNPINCPVHEVGYFMGEFYGINGNFGVELFLDHTLNYTNTYTEIPIDTTVAFWSVSGHYPQISRGTEPGELYLVSWWLEPNYKIFHSVDTGYTWTEKYESEYIDLYFWRVHYTAGRAPGSFYVMRSRINPAGDHIWLYIEHSSDYGETFTTYFHELDSTITSINSTTTNNIELLNYPNPFKNKTTFSFQLPENCTNPVLNVFNVKGNLIRQYNVSGKNTQQWDGTDNYGNKVCEGMYFYYIRCKEFSSGFKKILICH